MRALPSGSAPPLPGWGEVYQTAPRRAAVATHLKMAGEAAYGATTEEKGLTTRHGDMVAYAMQVQQDGTFYQNPVSW